MRNRTHRGEAKGQFHTQTHLFTHILEIETFNMFQTDSFSNEKLGKVFNILEKNLGNSNC